MSLLLGARLGPYEVLATLGQGGMGEVYRARDTRLGRDVALKILPDLFAHDPDRLARFGREAHVLASLSHPNIGGIYGLEELEGTRALVLELVDGPTLADRIAQGPLPVDEALRVARQIADALEAAHHAGVIHRDLKPANIKLRPDGTVKVLDFGLAKPAEASAAGSSLSLSPTITTPAMTQAGLILGTAAYMSPEQAKGKALDRRADIWAFGVVLFEMLSGSRPFPGEDVSDVMASVLAREPQLAALPPEVPAPVRRAISLCLQKDPRARIHDMADLRLALEGAFATEVPVPTVTAATPVSRRRLLAAAAAVLLVAGAGAGAAWTLKPAEPRPVARISHPLADQAFTRTGRPLVAISRDGQRIAYVADSRIFLRHLEEWNARPIAGTDENPSSPVFSPDGEWVGFWSADRALKKVRLSGGTPVRLTTADNPMGLSWGADGQLLYGQADGIWRITENGGIPERIVQPGDGERVHAPQMLPGSSAVLFAVTTPGNAGWDAAHIVVQRIDTGERTVVHAGGADPRYVSTGHLVYVLGSTLFARPFDAGRISISGGPVPVLSGVRRADAADTGIAQYAIADTGTLVYVSGAGSELHVKLALADRTGSLSTLPGSAASAIGITPRFNNDDSRIAVHRVEGGTPNVWIYEVRQAQWRQLTFDGGDRPVWAPDGRWIVYRRQTSLWRVPADFSGAPEPLSGTDIRDNQGPFAWSPDGQVLLYGGGPTAILVHHLTAGSADTPVSEAPALRPPNGATIGASARFSPDGRWVVYVVSDTVGPSVWVSPFPFGTGASRRIVNDPATAPIWSRAGGEIFLINARSGMAQVVPITAGAGTLDWQNPETLFAASLVIQGVTNYDVSRDGQQLVVTVPAGTESDAAAQEVRIVVNWTEELKRLVSPRQAR
jgi:eukaryotic-like serine/threonine-protein kinase